MRSMKRLASRQVKLAAAVLGFVGVLASAHAEQTYTLKENVPVGAEVPIICRDTSQTHMTTVEGDGKSHESNLHETQYFAATEKVLEVKDGSANKALVTVSSDSFDTQQESDGPVTRSACVYAGSAITLTREPDQSIASTWRGAANEADRENLDGILIPDEDFFPDEPVAPGDVWDSSKKIAPHSELGPTDRLIVKCRLDWVRDFDGRKIGKVSSSSAEIQHLSDSAEQDSTASTVMLVDIAKSQIIFVHMAGHSAYLQPKDLSPRIGSSTDYVNDDEVVGAVPTGARAAALAGIKDPVVQQASTRP